MTPTEIIEHRARLFTECNGGGVYSLYSERSEMKALFADEVSFCEHFGMLAEMSEHSGLKIVRETVKKNLSEVTYIEYFTENGHLRTYFSKTRFVTENGRWKIFKEERELHSD